MLHDVRVRIVEMLEKIPQDDSELNEMWSLLRPLPIESFEYLISRIEPNFRTIDLEIAQFARWRRGNWHYQGMRHVETGMWQGVLSAYNPVNRNFRQGISFNDESAAIFVCFAA